jgi:5-methylcytosine-specific restriction endonuclease McrA
MSILFGYYVGTSLVPRKNRGRQKFLSLEPISQTSIPGNLSREQWIEEVCAGFVSPSRANRQYYRVLLEELWPNGHGIPGPYVTTDKLREAVNRYRLSKHTGDSAYKPYVDVFRRVRELQGEEGVVGIAREGNTYQLVNLTVAEKRKPRIKLIDEVWDVVVESYKHRCAVCGKQEPDIRLEQDHKVPRTRGGGDELENWQPLCGECNNFKSTSCRGCQLDCNQCAWAFPEQYAPIKISSINILRIRNLALEKRVMPEVILNEIIQKFFQD